LLNDLIISKRGARITGESKALKNKEVHGAKEVNAQNALVIVQSGIGALKSGICSALT